MHGKRISPHLPRPHFTELSAQRKGLFPKLETGLEITLCRSNFRNRNRWQAIPSGADGARVGE